MADALGAAAAAVLGAVGFFGYVGWTFLNPLNVSWLLLGDRAMHTLGWWFYRTTPWGLPLGVNPRNGIEISSSIALSDSLPLFALPFKLLSPILPTVFQYWGIWLLVSMVLQGVVGYAIGRELRLSRLASVALGGMIVLTPCFLFRIPVHMALAGHWTLLVGLYLYVRQQAPARWMWPLALAVISAVHAYLLAMVLAIWVASLAERLWRGRIGWMGAVVEFVAGVAASLLVLWGVGFFMTPSLGAEGYGFYRFNLNSFFNPNGWSWLLPDLPSTQGDYEGFIYPGLGLYLLLAVGIVVALPRLRAIITPRWLPLLVVVILMAIFAATNEPVFGKHELGTYAAPEVLLNLASMFRASGRMIWPAGYLLVLIAFVLVDRRLGARWLVPLAAFCILVQAVDTSRGWLTTFVSGQVPPADSWPNPMQSPFWAEAAMRYPHLRALPVEKVSRDWQDLSYFAAFHGMASDAAYLGRLDTIGFGKLLKAGIDAMAQGQFDEQALYVLVDPRVVNPIGRFIRPDDLLAKVDGYIVFAPHGKVLAAMPGVSEISWTNPLLAPLSPPHPLSRICPLPPTSAVRTSTTAQYRKCI